MAAAYGGGGSSTTSGESVSLNSAKGHSVVWACYRAISEPCGFLPLNMMRRTPSGKQFAIAHPMYSALHDAPNNETTAQVFRETITGHALLQGNGYAQILRRSATGVAIELRTLSPANVKVDRERGGQQRLVYVVSDGGGPDVSYTLKRDKPHDILHIRGLSDNGVIGQALTSVARESIGTALASERTVGRFFGSGARVPYILKLDKPFTDQQQKDAFRNDWESIYSQAHRAPILPPGISYDQIGLTMVESQMLEQRQFTIPEICRWFNVSPHLAGDLSRATFSNVEQLALDHVKFCLTAWFVRWEQELNRCILTAEEKASGYYFKYNINALLRGDFASRMAGYASALQNGHANIDEVRDLEDLNPLPDDAGQAYHIQMNMATIPGTGDPMISEQALLNKTPATQPPPPPQDELQKLRAEVAELRQVRRPTTKIVHRNSQGLVERIEEQTAGGTSVINRNDNGSIASIEER
jgi:HK97 family phage portal protein